MTATTPGQGKRPDQYEGAGKAFIATLIALVIFIVIRIVMNL